MDGKGHKMAMLKQRYKPEREKMKILAIDPAPIQSGYVITENYKILDFGKVENVEILKVIKEKEYDKAVIEMITSYGMAVGQEVFDTCVKIGYFSACTVAEGKETKLIPRREVKLALCGKVNCKDSDVIQALVNRFAKGQPNYGKGTKHNPGFFYGFKADVWQAYALATIFTDREEQKNENNNVQQNS